MTAVMGAAPEAARADDLESIRALLAQCRLPGTDLTPAHLRHFLVLRDGDAIAGVAGLEIFGRDGLLRSVAVDPARQNRGLGEALTGAIEGLAVAAGLKSLYLLTTTAADYFARRGYRRIDRSAVPDAVQKSEEFSALCPASATCMVRQLASAEGPGR